MTVVEKIKKLKAKAAVKEESKRVKELIKNGFENYEEIGYTFPGVDVKAVHKKWKKLMANELVLDPKIDF